MNHPCPHCQQPCVSSWQKLFMGPSSSTNCRSCGKRVTLPGKYYLLIILPLLALFIVLHVLKLELLHIVFILLIGGALLSWIQIRFVPLRKEKLDELL